jgi:tetratricopeptide (TPR) repeat protein
MTNLLGIGGKMGLLKVFIFKFFIMQVGISYAATSSKKEALSLYRAARILYQKGEYEKAIEKLINANRLFPSPNFIFNIARSYEKLNKFDQAILYYRRYLELVPQTPERKNIEGIISLLLQRKELQKAQVIISSDPSGAKVFLNGEEKGKTTVRFILESGTYKLRLEKEGYRALDHEFKAEKGKVIVIDLRLSSYPSYGFLGIKANLAAARVSIDGKDIGRTPIFDKVKLTEGLHKVRITKKGYIPLVTIVNIKKGKTVQLKANLISVPLPSKSKPSRFVRFFGYIALGLGVIFLGTGVGFGYYSHRAEKRAGNQDLDYEIRKKAEKDAYQNASTANLFYGVSVATLTAGVISLLGDIIRAR